jgi:hypothetical protein
MKLSLLSLSLCAMIAASTLLTSCSDTTSPTTVTAYHDSTADVTGLTAGTVYYFNISGGASGSRIKGVSSYTNGTVRVFWTRAVGDTNQILAVNKATSTASDDIAWSAANLTTAIRLYETADVTAGHPSGLVLGNTSSSLSIGDASAATKIDLVLATDPSASSPAPHLVLVSADDALAKISGTPRSADFGHVDLVTGGLINDYLNASLTTIDSNAATSAGAYIIPQVNNGRSAVVPIRTADRHYARVEIIPQASNANGLFALTSGARYYIDVNVTYQPVAYRGYADRPEGVNHHAPWTRRAAESSVLN